MEESIKLEQRFQQGKITYIGEDVIQVDLLSTHFKGKHARIAGKKHIPKNISLKKFQNIDIFITGKSTAPNSQHYYASITWANKEQNPWTNSHPKQGKVYEGLAIQYPKFTDGVIVELQTDSVKNPNISGITGILRLEDSPGDYNNINELIDIGDKISVSIKHIDTDTLHVALSINEALVTLKEQESNYRFHNANQELIHLIDRIDCKKDTPKRSKVKAVGVLGFDRYFTDHLVLWLSLYGYQASRIEDISHLERIIKPANAPSHLVLCSSKFRALMSYEKKRLIEQIKSKSIEVQWIAEKANNPPAEMPALSTPVHLDDIIGILEKNENYEEQEHSHIEEFQLDAYQENHVRKVTTYLLEKICSTYDFSAALWVERERKGVYAVWTKCHIAQGNIDFIRYKLNQTYISTSIEGKREITIELHRAGELKKIAPEESRYLWIFPIPFLSFGDQSEPEVDRAVAFFSYEPFTTSRQKEIIKQYLPIMQSYIETLYFARHNEGLTAFARIGMNSVSLMHEIARYTSNIKDQVHSLCNKEQTNSENLSSLYKNIKQLDALSKSNMLDVMKTSSSNASIKEIITALANEFSFRANIQHTALDVKIPDYPLRIHLPRLAISHTVRNLLDNAFYYVKPLKSQGRIRIRVIIDSNYSKEMPLHIDIIDNGIGVKASMFTVLFKPRYSAKGNEGIGMGLHISQGLIRSVGGDLSLRESVRWERTVFRISLPIVLDKMRDM